MHFILGRLLSARSRSKILVMGRRIAYGLLGVAIGVVICSALHLIRRPHDREAALRADFGPCIVRGTLAVYIAERRGKVKTIEELHRPLTLFPRDPA
jgi:hypothetical protein